MKMTITKRLFATLLFAFTSVSVFSQVQERTYVLDPKQVPAQPQGYKIAGVTVEKNGVPTYFNGCGEGDAKNVTEHGAADHNEHGTSGGFTFANASIMTPDCNGKGTPDADIPTGYIMLRELTNWNAYVADPEDKELVYGTITSQPVTNIKSLTVQAGSALSIGSRDVVIGVVYSTDGGKTWDKATTRMLTQQGGRTYVFEANSDDPGFNQLATLSTTRPVMVRIMSWIGNRASDITSNRSHRLQIYNVTLVATGAAVTSIKSEIADNNPFFKIEQNAFIANKGSLFVYNLTGALVGAGSEVAIPGKGLFIIRSDTGLSKKVFLQ